MDGLAAGIALALAAAVGVVLGVALGMVLAVRRYRGAGTSAGPLPTPPGSSSRDRLAPVPGPAPSEVVPAWLGDVLDVLRGGAVVLDVDDEVILSNPAARALGLVRGRALAVPELARVVRDCRSDGETRVVQIDLPRSARRPGPTSVRARVAVLGDGGHVSLLVDDVSEARRVDAMRRDFVANVSHELKTPVGALSLLAEALGDAADDPEAVRRFAGRVQHESSRLSRLVQELIDLSRLQGADPPPPAEDVRVDSVVAEALDRNRLHASARDVELAAGGETGLLVRGSEAQLVTALSNLLANAVTYSHEGGRVGVGVRRREDMVEIAVTDRGIGIPDAEHDRVFERFYRSDPARSRATGGTGLGLAIVKHVASNHGGSVSLWSTEGEGSTFTLRLPALAPPTTRPDSEETPVPSSRPPTPSSRAGSPVPGGRT